MQDSRLKTQLFLVGLFLVLLVIAAVGWVVRTFTAMATWGADARRARSRHWAGRSDGARQFKISALDGETVQLRGLFP
jgi:uncharacterized protein HemY